MIPKRWTPCTDTTIRALKPQTAAYDVPDGDVPGLAIRVSPEGKKTFRLRFRIDGVQRAMTVGFYSLLSLKEARTLAKDALARAARGEDPTAPKRQARAKRRAGGTNEFVFTKVVARYGEVWCNRNMKPRSAEEAIRCLTVEWGRNAGFARRDVREITSEDIVVHLDRIVARGHHDANALSALRGLYKWLVGRKMVSVTPTADLRHNSKAKPRGRFLSDEEIVKVWKAADRIGFPYGHVVKLLMLTGTRREQVAGITWAEIDEAKHQWIIPHERTKKRRNSESNPHLVPLSSFVLRIIKSVPWLDDDFVFPAERADTKSGHVADWAAKKDELVKLSGVSDFRHHDLRRTMTTGLGALRLPSGKKVERHIKQMLIHHSAGNDDTMGKHYDLYEYEDEKREALQLWSDHVERLTTPLLMAAE